MAAPQVISYQEQNCCCNKISLTLSVYMILVVFILQSMIDLTRLITEREPSYSRMTALKCVANVVSFLLSVGCIFFFVCGLKNPDIYSRR